MIKFEEIHIKNIQQINLFYLIINIQFYNHLKSIYYEFIIIKIKNISIKLYFNF